MNVYPEDLEAALRRQPEVKDCVVLGLPRDGNAEPCAVMILRDRTAAEPVVQRANQSLAEYQRIRTWFVWPEEDFPRTSTQKPRTNVILQAVQTDLASKSAAGSSPLAELLSRVTGRNPGELRADARLENELNLSFLERVELFGALEDRYQMALSETQFTSVKTLGD